MQSASEFPASIPCTTVAAGETVTFTREFMINAVGAEACNHHWHFPFVNTTAGGSGIPQCRCCHCGAYQANIPYYPYRPCGKYA